MAAKIDRRVFLSGKTHTWCKPVLVVLIECLKSGDDIKTVQENLGHATAAFTLDVYGHVTSQMKQASASRMEQFIGAVSS